LAAGTYQIQVMDSEGCELDAIEEYEIGILDDMPPVANCNSFTIELDEFGYAAITVDQVDNNSTDNCAIIDMYIDVNEFSCANVGDNDVVLTVIDSNGNEDSCTATNAVVDNIPPTAICQGTSVEINYLNYASITLDDINDGSFDNCAIDTMWIYPYEFTNDDAANSPVEVTLTVIDVNGNESTCIALVDVEPYIPMSYIYVGEQPVVPCYGDETGAISIIVEGGLPGYMGYGYSIDGGANYYYNGGMFEDLPAGLYYIWVKDSVSVLEYEYNPLEVHQQAKVQIDDVVTTNVVCAGDQTGGFVIYASGGLSPLWYSIDGGITYQVSNEFTGLAEGVYDLQVMDYLGCELDSPEPYEIIVLDDMPPVANCNSFTVELDDSGYAGITAEQVDNNSTDRTKKIDYKDVELLKRFLTDRGKIQQNIPNTQLKEEISEKGEAVGIKPSNETTEQFQPVTPTEGTETGLQRGSSVRQYSIVSPMRRTAGRVGYIQAPRPIISLRMSFWGVAEILSRSNPFFSARA